MKWKSSKGLEQVCSFLSNTLRRYQEFKLEPSEKISFCREGDDAPTAREFRKESEVLHGSIEMDKSFLSRYVNDGFSGGEKKRFEILQMLLLNPH